MKKDVEMKILENGLWNKEMFMRISRCILEKNRQLLEE